MLKDNYETFLNLTVKFKVPECARRQEKYFIYQKSKYWHTWTISRNLPLASQSSHVSPPQSDGISLQRWSSTHESVPSCTGSLSTWMDDEGFLCKEKYKVTLLNIQFAIGIILIHLVSVLLAQCSYQSHASSSMIKKMSAQRLVLWV